MQRIVPNLWFDHTASEAVDFYTSVFECRVGTASRWPEPIGLAPAGSVQFADFELLGQWFAAMDS